jgi:hypothetical protein
MTTIARNAEVVKTDCFFFSRYNDVANIPDELLTFPYRGDAGPAHLANNEIPLRSSIVPAHGTGSGTVHPSSEGIDVWMNNGSTQLISIRPAGATRFPVLNFQSLADYCAVVGIGELPAMDPETFHHGRQQGASKPLLVLVV